MDGAGEGGLDGAEFFDGFGDFGGGGVDVFGGGEAGEGDAETAFGAFVGEAHGFLDVGGLLLAGHAGGAGGEVDAGFVEEDEEAGAFAVVEGGVADVGGAVFAGAVEVDAFDFGGEALFEVVAELLDTRPVVVGGEFAGFAEGDDVGDVFGTGAVAVFLSAAAEEGFEAAALAEVEGADALGGVEFVAGDGEHVDGDGADVDGDFADGLDGVGVDGGVGGFELFGGLGDGLVDAGLVVGPHEGGEGGEIGVEVGGELVEVEAAVLVDADGFDVEADGGHGFDGAEDGGVFDGGGEDLGVFASDEAGEGFEGGVVGFGAAGGEDDFVGVGVDELGDLFAGGLDGGFDGFGGAVSGRGVVVVFLEEREHGLEDVGVDGGGGVVVEVDHGGGSLATKGTEVTELDFELFINYWKEILELDQNQRVG